MKNIGLFALLLLVAACQSNNGSSSESAKEDSDELSEYDYITDSIDDIQVSHDCAIIYTQLDRMQWNWERIKSPSMLATQRAAWKEQMGNIDRMRKSLVASEEIHIIDSIRQAIIDLRNARCKEFSVPASGIIANLNDCIKEIDKVNSVEDLTRFQSYRRGIIGELDELYLCVEEKSRDIGNVKRLSESLKNKYVEKCNKFGLKP